MLTLLIRGVLIYAIVFLVFRLMGKRQLGQLQPFEFVITLIIADLATIPMSEINIPLLHGIVPLVTISLIHFLIGFLSRKSIRLRKFFNGKPIIVVSPQGVEYEALKQLNMDFDDLCEALREVNIFSLDQVQYAIIETNGQISVLPNAKNSPLTAFDMKIKKEDTSLPIMIVCDGKKLKDNMKLANMEESVLTEQIKLAGANKLKDVLIATIDKTGKMFIQVKNKKYVSTTLPNFKGGESL